MTTIPEFEVDIKKQYNEIVVPTADSVRMKHLLKELIINGKNILMPGPTGVGKSVYINQLCTYDMDDKNVIAFIFPLCNYLFHQL